MGITLIIQGDLGFSAHLNGINGILTQQSLQHLGQLGIISFAVVIAYVIT